MLHDNTVVFHLTAGNHTVKFAGVSTTDATSILDNVSLRKRLAGELHVVAPEGQTAELSAVKFEGAFRVVIEGAGTCLLAADCDWTGHGAVIDTTLDLCGRNLFVSELKGAGTVTDSTALGEDAILNGGFETTSISANSGLWGYIGTASSSNWEGSTQAGFTKAGSPWATSVKGNYSAYIQDAGYLLQTVSVPEAGDYVLSYSYKARPNYLGHTMNLIVDDLAQTGGQTVASAADWAVNTLVLHLTADDHVIKPKNGYAKTSLAELIS